MFALKQLDDLDYFFAIEVNHDANGSLLLSQSKYIWDLLEKAEISETKGISKTPA